MNRTISFLLNTCRIKYKCGPGSDLARLGLTPKEALGLCKLGIRTRNDLWRTIGVDPHSGIATLATRTTELVKNSTADEKKEVTNIGSERLKDLLAAKAHSEARFGQGQWILRFWPEAILLVSALLVLYTFVR